MNLKCIFKRDKYYTYCSYLENSGCCLKNKLLNYSLKEKDFNFLNDFVKLFEIYYGKSNGVKHENNKYKH